jgi:glycosyltransferase involved in cell wall biosynthesis
VAELLSSHDVLVFPSIAEEAYALGVLEALAAGTLVVTSASGGPRDYLRHEVNALLHEPGDPDALAAALGRLRDEPGLVARLLEGARATAREISLEAVLDRVESLLPPAARAA